MLLPSNSFKVVWAKCYGKYFTEGESNRGYDLAKISELKERKRRYFLIAFQIPRSGKTKNDALLTNGTFSLVQFQPSTNSELDAHQPFPGFDRLLVKQRRKMITCLKYVKQVGCRENEVHVKRYSSNAHTYIVPKKNDGFQINLALKIRCCLQSTLNTKYLLAPCNLICGPNYENVAYRFFVQ